MVIAITNQDASLTLTSWFNTASRPTQFQFNDGTVISPEAIAAWRIAPITGTAGDDVLTGSAYDDLIQGNAGNDTLNGGGGNDRLEGGAGLDTYVLKAGNSGLATVWEQDGESSVIKLEGLDFADLTAEQNGDDLMLTWLSHDQGLVLKDYFVQAHQWKVMDYSGEERQLAEVLSDNNAQNAMLGKVARLEKEFIANWRTEMAGELLADGAVQLTDGRFEQKPAVNFYYHQSTYSPSSAQTNAEYGNLSVSDWTFTSLGIETVTVEEVAELSSQYHNGIGFVSGQDNRYDYSVQEVNLDKHRRVE